MSKAWRNGSTRRWREKVRPAVLERDGYLCRIKTPGTCKTRADCVDHIHGKSLCPGCEADYLSHLQAACTPCNLKKGQPKREPRATTADMWR